MSSARRLLAAATLVLAFTPATPALAAEPGVSAIGLEHNGVNETASAVEALAGAPAERKWASIVISWALLQPDGPGDPMQQGGANLLRGLDEKIAEYRRSGVRVMGVVTQAPAWSHGGAAEPNRPPHDVADYARFMAFLADRYAGNVAAWQLWNEPDKGVFWIGGPEPDKYTALLQQSSAAIKAAVAAKGAGADVIVGGLTGNNYDFLQSLYARGARGSFDGVGTHTSTACLLVGPDFYYREPTGRLGPNVFTAYREVRQTMLANGDDKPIYMEIGWSTTPELCDRGPEAGRKPGGVSEAEQASFLTRAYSCLAADPFVRMATWFSLQDADADPRPYDHRMGLVSFDGGRRAAFGALQGVAAGYVTPDPSCGGKVDVDAPSASLDVPASYVGRLTIKGAAADPTTKISRIELWVDGARVEGVNQPGPGYALDWFGSTKLPLGAHTIELRAYDEAHNVGRAARVVTRIGPTSAAARSAKARFTFGAKRARGRKIVVTARVLKALTGTTEAPRGRLQIHFARKDKKRWKRVSRYTKSLKAPIKLTYKPKKKGVWRVWAELQVDAPYVAQKSKTFTFKVR